MIHMIHINAVTRYSQQSAFWIIAVLSSMHKFSRLPLGGVTNCCYLTLGVILYELGVILCDLLESSIFNVSM